MLRSTVELSTQTADMWVSTGGVDAVFQWFSSGYSVASVLAEYQRKDSRDMPETTWTPHDEHGRLTMQSELPDSAYAFPKQRKEPLTDAQHVRNAVARFDQVIEVSDADRALAFANIGKGAEYYGVNLSETSWHELGIHPRESAD